MNKLNINTINDIMVSCINNWGESNQYFSIGYFCNYNCSSFHHHFNIIYKNADLVENILNFLCKLGYVKLKIIKKKSIKHKEIFHFNNGNSSYDFFFDGIPQHYIHKSELKQKNIKFYRRVICEDEIIKKLTKNQLYLCYKLMVSK